MSNIQKIHTLAKVGVVVTIFDNKTFSFFLYLFSLIMTGVFLSEYTFALKDWLDCTNCLIYKLLVTIPINKNTNLFIKQT